MGDDAIIETKVVIFLFADGRHALGTRYTHRNGERWLYTTGDIWVEAGDNFDRGDPIGWDEEAEMVINLKASPRCIPIVNGMFITKTKRGDLGKIRLRPIG